MHLMTSKETLIDRLWEAWSRLESASEALQLAAPHDYYPLGDGAQAKHQDRLERLNALMEEVDALASSIEVTE